VTGLSEGAVEVPGVGVTQRVDLDETAAKTTKV